MVARLLHNFNIKLNGELGRYKREKIQYFNW